MAAVLIKIRSQYPMPITPQPEAFEISVAVVEDDEWIRESLARQIDQTPGFCCVHKFRTAEDALKGLPAAVPDVVLMDINLPKMSGINCLRELKRTLPDIDVLMLTVYEDTDRIFDSLKAGANGYLLKRSSHAELIEAIVQVHAGGSPMTGLIARKVVDFFKQQEGTSPDLERLSPREHEILVRLGEGAAYKQIADILGLSIDTVRMYVRRIYKKLHVHSRGEAVAKYLRR